jgi:ATP-dependent Clp protease ATP-binding subunit ClpB
MTGIVEIQLERLKKLLVDRKIALEIDGAAAAWLGTAGYDPVYGARPLKRVIQRELQNPLAQQILEGRIPDGATVKITASPLGLVIGAAAPAESSAAA